MWDMYVCTTYEEQNDIDILTDHRHMLHQKIRIYEEFNGRPIHVLHTCLGDFFERGKGFLKGWREYIFVLHVCESCVHIWRPCPSIISTYICCIKYIYTLSISKYSRWCFNFQVPILIGCANVLYLCITNIY